MEIIAKPLSVTSIVALEQQVLFFRTPRQIPLESVAWASAIQIGVSDQTPDCPPILWDQVKQDDLPALAVSPIQVVTEGSQPDWPAQVRCPQMMERMKSAHRPPFHELTL